MSFTHILRAAQRLALPVLLVVLGGCASQRLQDQGMVMIDEGRLEEGLALMRRATVENPGDLGGRVALIRARENAVERIMAEGREAELEGRHDEAAAAYQRAQAMDPDNPRVRDALRMPMKEG